MSAQKHVVALGQSEVQDLENLIRKGVNKARVITRARVLLMANENGEGKTDAQISEALGLAWSTPGDIRRRYVQGGLKRALYDAPRSGAPRTISGKDRAVVCAIACTDAPDGYDRWTLDLIREESEKQLGKYIGRSTVHKILLKNELKPWRKKNVEYSGGR